MYEMSGTKAFYDLRMKAKQYFSGFLLEEPQAFPACKQVCKQSSSIMKLYIMVLLQLKTIHVHFQANSHQMYMMFVLLC